MSHLKLYETRGAHYDHDTQTTQFCLYAPNGRNVWIVLNSYGIEQYRLEMIKTHDGLWEIVTDKASTGRTYLYLINDYHGRQKLRTDSVSFSVISNLITRRVQSIVHDEQAYQWADQNWMRQRARTNRLKSSLSIYEIQPKSWKSSVYWPMNYRQIADELVTYCHQMGFTHVEMYGILDHTDRWEYMIDHLHQNDIGVILDWVPTHFKHFHFFHAYLTFHYINMMEQIYMLI